MLPLRCGLTTPAATALACLPYWMETAAWAAALLSDAMAAAMGRLPSSEPRTKGLSKIDTIVRRPCIRAGVVKKNLWERNCGYTESGWMP